MNASRTRTLAGHRTIRELCGTGLLVLLALSAACATTLDAAATPGSVTSTAAPRTAELAREPPAIPATAPGSTPTPVAATAVSTPITELATPTTAATAEQAAAPPTPTVGLTPTAATTPIPPSPTPPRAEPTPTSPAPTTQPATATTPSTQLWRQEAADFAAASLDGVVVVENVLRLAGEAGQYNGAGQLVSAEHETPFPFNDVVLSWNASGPAGTGLRFDVRARQADGWTSWYTLGTWKDGVGASVANQSDDRARVEIDTLKLRTPATALQYRVSLTTSNPAVTPEVRLIALVYADLSKPLTGPPLERPAGAVRELDVPTYSQLDQDPAVARAICSPTSLSMVLAYWNKGLPVPDVVRGVRDRVTGIYGNWPLNTAFAATQGLEAYVDRFYAVEQLEAEIAAGRPVIASIRFERGQLDGAPLLSTDGHLLVVRGFTPEGDVIVNDPFGQGAGIRRVYDREQFANIWIGNGGIVYLVRPPGSNASQS